MKSICPTKIHAELPSGILLDICEKFEFDTYRANYERVMNLPFSEFENIVETLNENQKFILICNNDLRSKTAAQYLKERGFKDVSYINGGLVKWQQNDLEIIGNPPDLISHSLSLTKECL